MDIIVLELPNGHIHSTSFHVRFSSKQVLTSDEVDILIYINGKKKDIKMKLSKSGDAYFSLEKIDKYILDQSNIKIKENDDDFYYMDMNINNVNDNKNSSLFPSEEILRKMDLNIGINEIFFAIETYFGGIQVLKSNIYFYKSNSNFKFILWDIDGTITKSDILGVILPRIGLAWNHDNVVELINKLYNQGYLIIYLTARAIFQSEATHDFLNNIKENNEKLPQGPIIMDPDGIFSSFKKGILQKQTYLIKILSLLEIKNLFDDNEQHFFAGFGNKETDAIAYRYLGIDLKNIYIINTYSKIKQLGEKNDDTTYKELCQNCDSIFPKII